MHDLRYKANILHRDISINNIMYQIRDGRYYFILIDFDMAVHVKPAASSSTSQTSYAASSKNRTGTLPFMACELIFDAYRAVENGKDWVPVPHLLRHDLESLFHVSCFAVSGLARPHQSKSDAKKHAKQTKKLETGTLDALSEHKLRVCRLGLEQNEIKLKKPLDILLPWFDEWSRFFRRAWNYRDDMITELDIVKRNPNATLPPYDDETIDGLFTCERLQAALTPVIPAKSRRAETQSEPSKKDAPATIAPRVDVSEKGLTRPKTKGASKRAAPNAKVESKAGADNKERKMDGSKKGSKKTPTVQDKAKYTPAEREYRSRLRSSTK